MYCVSNSSTRCGESAARTKPMWCFISAVDDLGLGEAGSIRAFLARERHHNATKSLFEHGEAIGAGSAADFELRPFTPEIHAGGVFHHLSSVGTAHAGTGLDEVDLPIGVGLHELSMRCTPAEAKAFEKL